MIAPLLPFCLLSTSERRVTHALSTLLGSTYKICSGAGQKSDFFCDVRGSSRNSSSIATKVAKSSVYSSTISEVLSSVKKLRSSRAVPTTDVDARVLFAEREVNDNCGRGALGLLAVT